MIFSEKMWLMVILEVNKKAGLHPLSRKYIFRKTTGRGQIDPLVFLG